MAMYLPSSIVLIAISLAFFPSCVVYAQQCFSMPGSALEGCTVAGYNDTYPIPVELTERSKGWVENFISYILSFGKNCSVASMGETIMCSIYSPSCTEGNRSPNLPCQRVCSEFLKRCHGYIDPFWLEYYVGFCTLLPNKTASTGQCFEPPGFDQHYNASTKGLLEHKCTQRVIFPWCQGIGYEYTIMKEATQISEYSEFYGGKNFTNDSTIDQVFSNDSAIEYWNSYMKNHSDCAVEIKKMICADLFPPCFPDEGLAFYTLCRQSCSNILKKCSGIDTSEGFGMYISYCEAYASGTSSHGFCKHTSWPKPMEWLYYFKDRQPFVPRPTMQPSSGIGTAIIVISVVVPVIVIGLAVMGVVLWRQRKLLWFLRFFKKEADTKGFVQEETD